MSLFRWYVVTPEYCEVVPVTDEGQGPLEYSADVIEVEAISPGDALVLGVKAMRSDPRAYPYFRKHCDGSPYAGVRVIPVSNDELVDREQQRGGRTRKEQP